MSNLYRFGQFVLNPRKRTLSRSDSPVSLTPKAFDVLLFLAQNPNRPVTKEELLQAVWGEIMKAYDVPVPLDSKRDDGLVGTKVDPLLKLNFPN
jgi:DNA-binding winged helix-turn-helix (wHTH) protein